MTDANFEQMNFLSAEARKMAIINVEIMHPFVNESSRVAFKILEQVVHRPLDPREGLFLRQAKR